MKRILLSLFLSGAISFIGYAQQSVSIGTDQINNNAVLWLQGNGSQGLILPVVTNRTAVTATKGMIVFDDSDKKVYYNNGTTWIEVGAGGSGVAQTLTLNGNTLSISDGNSVKIATSDPTVSGQLLMWDGAKWVAVTLSQDIANLNGAITVNGLKGGTLPALPATTQALVYNGTSWVFQPLSAGGITSITAGTGLTGGVITSTGTINVDVGTTANKIVQLDASGRLPAVDGSQLTNLAGGGDITGVTAGTGLTGGATSGNATLNVDAGITANKIVQLDASGRLPAVDGSQLTNLAGGGDITGVTAGTGLTGGATSGNATLNVDAGITANKIVQLDGAGRLPAVDGSQLTNLPGGGTVTNVSVVSANGVSGVVSNASSTPAITLSLGAITPSSVAATGTISGANLSGTNTGDQTTITGNAGTATVLQTGRTIGMTGDVTYTSPSFNGSGNVTAPATVTRINGNTIPSNASGALTNDGSGNLSWIPSGGSGTVTSVGLTLPAIFSVAGSPVTTAGTLAATLASQPAATVFAAPTGSAGAPTFRALAATDIPTLDASKITTGTLPIAQGGTGATSPAAALTNLGAMGNTLNTGQVFVGNASNIATGVAVSGDATLSSLGNLTIANDAITSAKILNGEIVDADVNAAATIAGTKINPNFGAQNISTTGSTSTSQLIVGNEIRLGANPGTLGQVLTSAGPGAVPTWGNASTGWGLTGNPGINPASNFIGTTDNQPFIIRTNNIENVSIIPDTELNINNINDFTVNAKVVGPLGFGNINLKAHASKPDDPGDLNFLKSDGSNIAKIWTSVLSRTLWISTDVDPENNKHLTLGTTGNLGIANTSPAEKLDVIGNVRFSGALMPNNASGTVGQVLTSGGPGAPPTWAASGLSNPMTTTGDLIYGGVAGLPTRLPLGTVGQVLTATAGGVSWSAAGSSPLLRNNGIETIFVGQNAGIVNDDVTGTANTFVGFSAGFSNTTGTANTFVGRRAGYANTGSYNTFVGRSAGIANTTGALNTLVGFNAGFTMDGASGNTLLGAESGYAVTTGGLNVFVGEKSGLANTTGSNNIFIGRQAGDTNTAGFQNILIGSEADVSTTNLSNAIAIGNRALVSQSNSLILGSINGVNGASANTSVGIGTTAPAGLLHVNSGTAVTVASRFTNSSTGATGSDGFAFGINGSGGAFINNDEATSINISTNSVTRMTIGPTGNIGIGNTTPNAPLQLGSTIANRKLVLYDVNNNDHQFYGFGVQSGEIRYQTQSNLSNHRFYAGTSTTTSALLMTISGAGNVAISGSLSKGSGTFKIDHPVDPENKFLYHSFVESPEMMNVYNGNTETDAQGNSTITLPTYFEALNKDFRYQLTVIGQFAQAIVLEEISENKFVIKTDKPNVKVSWQVTGVRKDPFAEKNRVVPEVEKSTEEKGKYLHPEAYGLPVDKKIGNENIEHQ